MTITNQVVVGLSKVEFGIATWEQCEKSVEIDFSRSEGSKITCLFSDI